MKSKNFLYTFQWGNWKTISFLAIVLSIIIYSLYSLLLSNISPNLPESRVIFSDENICIKFENPQEAVGDYERIVITTYNCSNKESIDSYTAYECMDITSTNDFSRIKMSRNRICEFFTVHEIQDHADEISIDVLNDGSIHRKIPIDSI